MHHGPSSLFSYKPPRKARRRVFSTPSVLLCDRCGAYVVSATNPRNGKRVFIPLDTFATSPSLVYSFEKHGYAHFHPNETPRFRT